MMVRDFLARLRFVCQKEMLATLNDKRVRFILVMNEIKRRNYAVYNEITEGWPPSGQCNFALT